MNTKLISLSIFVVLLLISLWVAVFIVHAKIRSATASTEQPVGVIAQSSSELRAQTTGEQVEQTTGQRLLAADTLTVNVTPTPEPSLAPAAQVSGETMIYTDGLANDWQEWSWGVTSQPASAQPVHSGQAAIGVTYDAGWGAFYLHTDTVIPGDEYDLLRFWIHGGSAGDQHMRVLLADEGTSFLAASKEVMAQADSWTLVEINLADLGAPRQISGIVWQDTTGDAQPTFYIDDLALVDLDLPPTPTPAPMTGPQLSVDLNAARRPISPEIYGINYADETLATVLNLPVRRWGGNATTRYNWQNDTSNRASDWFFENIPEENDAPEQLPNGSSADRFVEQDRRTGAKTLLTMPLIGWTAKSRDFACGFSVTKYGAQQQTDSWQADCGNGLTAAGDPLTGNDPTDTSTPIDPSFVQAWINHLTAQFGTAAEGGVAYYNLDNEPMLWHVTHRDIHPDPVGYDELRDRTYAYAAAIKAADPTAQTLGPAEWGWTGYFFSALDSTAGGSWWNQAPDRAAHDDVPLVPWYLQEMQRYEQEQGVRLLDYLDLHYYPQTSGVALAPLGDAETRERRLRSTRSLWDPTYQDESWIEEPVRLIPRMREWVDTYYPGTKLAIGEYNWGALDHLNGALAQADVLGIFGREGLDMAFLWAPLSADEPFAYAFRMYRNYDGADSTFGDTSVQAASSDQDKLAIYAAQRSSDQALTILVINKSNETFDSTIAIAGLPATTDTQIFQYSAADLQAIQSLPARTVTAGKLPATFPGQSLTLFVLGGSTSDAPAAVSRTLQPTTTP